MSDPVRVIMDSLVAVFLAMALLIVYGIDRSGRGKNDPGGEVRNDLKVNVVDESSRKAETAKKLRLVVCKTFIGKHPQTFQPLPWDDMGKLLTELGKGYDHFSLVETRDLLNPNTLEGADILFLTCHPKDPAIDLSETLRKFVARGGTLYASDWRFDDLATAFPDFVNRAQQGEGVDTPPNNPLTADVLDAGLQAALAEDRNSPDPIKSGKKLHLRFDLNRWKTAAFGGPRVTIMVHSQYKKMMHPKDSFGVQAEAPLLVKFTFEKGTVIFTSFHNEKQTSEVEKKLLQYLVFSLVTAKTDAEVANTINQGGFEAQPSNLLSAPTGKKSFERTYTSKKAGPLRFALAFRNEEGVRLALTIQSPEGKKFKWEGTSTVVLEVPDAPAGEWRYTVTAVETPYENFPFTVTIGEKK
jgi:hypothetical protein